MASRNQFAFAFSPSAEDGDVSPLRNASDLNLGKFDVTFRDSSRAPLHSWFPYLEGYSPRFVEKVRHEFLPNAKRVIEPFAGTGTTPIVLAQAGVDCAYAEANPAMEFVIRTKLAMLELPLNERIYNKLSYNLAITFFSHFWFHQKSIKKPL